MGKIMLNRNGQNIELNNEQIVEIMKKQQEQLQEFSKILKEKDKKIKELEEELDKRKSNEIIKTRDEKIKNENDISNINFKLDKLINIMENSINKIED